MWGELVKIGAIWADRSYYLGDFLHTQILGRRILKSIGWGHDWTDRNRSQTFRTRSGKFSSKTNVRWTPLKLECIKPTDRTTWSIAPNTEALAAWTRWQRGKPPQAPTKAPLRSTELDFHEPVSWQTGKIIVARWESTIVLTRNAQSWSSWTV